MDRKRRRKNTLYVSERHIRRFAAQEADIFCNSECHEIMSHDLNNKCTILVANDYTTKPTVTDIKHKMEIEYNENNETFVQNDDLYKICSDYPTWQICKTIL